jgi:outer membrane lipoprotein LolB
MRKVVGLLILIAFISSCATAVPLSPTADVDAAWNLRQATLKPVTSWHVRGRLALRAADQGWHATLNWERSGERHRLDFTGPLGRGHLRLVQDDHGAELQDAEQRIWRAGNAETLLYRATGWRVPLDGLNYWIVGLAAPESVSNQQLDAQGRLKRLTQSGWDIQFLEYTHYGSFDLPSKLYITRQGGRVEGNPAGDEAIEVRLSIERWTFKQ